MAKKSLKDRYGNYSLVVEASDLGEPSNEIKEEMFICVTDYNDHAPFFVSPPQNVTIRIPEVHNFFTNSIISEIMFENKYTFYIILECYSRYSSC